MKTKHFLGTSALLAAAMLSSGCGLFRVRPQKFPPYTTSSGLTVLDLVIPLGTGIEVGQRATIHYEARLENGEVFDSSYELGRPVTFLVGANEVPAGLDEGVVGMTLGGRRRLTLPPELAYGPAGVPGRVPPGSPVVFELELLGIE